MTAQDLPEPAVPPPSAGAGDAAGPGGPGDAPRQRPGDRGERPARGLAPVRALVPRALRVLSLAPASGGTLAVPAPLTPALDPPAEPVLEPTRDRCPACGRPQERFTLAVPGLGPRSFLALCPCEIARHEAEARARVLEARAARQRQLLVETGIGPRHAEATFGSFVATGNAAAVLAVCRAFVARFPDRGRGLTLAGPPGTGKSHLAVALTRALVERGVHAVFVNVPELLLGFRAAIGDEASGGFERRLALCTGCDHLVLDDLGRERTTPWVAEQLYLLVNARYNACRATTLTTNLDEAALRDHLGPALADRLAETNDAYWCQWASHRRGAAGREAP